MAIKCLDCGHVVETNNLMVKCRECGNTDLTLFDRVAIEIDPVLHEKERKVLEAIAKKKLSKILGE